MQGQGVVTGLDLAPEFNAYVRGIRAPAAIVYDFLVW
jgi:hypothetical protein